jgi:hypothetical protein
MTTWICCSRNQAKLIQTETRVRMGLQTGTHAQSSGLKLRFLCAVSIRRREPECRATNILSAQRRESDPIKELRKPHIKDGGSDGTRNPRPPA